jgi:hypothetical protein
MTKDEIIHLAEKRAACEQTMRVLGMQNSYGLTASEQVAASARYRIARDAYLVAEKTYADAVNGMSSDELSEVLRA